MEDNCNIEIQARPYQIDLYEQAVETNSIIYLPTGSGKTYIAVLLIKKYSTDVQKPLDEGGKRIAIIVDRVALVHQQSAYIARNVDLACNGYTSEMNVDAWTDVTWKDELKKNQILVMTAQIFLDILNFGYITMNQMSLIIFDECHHAVENHPMRQILQKLKNVPSDEQPRILGLSAALLNANVSHEKMINYIENLKATMHSRILTVRSNYLLDVKKFSTQPKESIILYKNSENHLIMDKINTIFENIKVILNTIKVQKDFDSSSENFQRGTKDQNIRRMINDTLTQFLEFGIYAGSKALLFQMIQLEYMKRTVINSELLILISYIISQFVLIRKCIDNEMGNLTETEKIWRFSTDKMLSLFSVLKQFKENKLPDQKFCAIIFAQRRNAVKVIYHVLKCLCNASEDYSFLKPGFVIGNDGNPDNLKESMCMNKWNKENILRFRNGTINCLVATNVLDEGIDVPLCTLVVHFSFPNDYRAYIQSKGRARHSTSEFKIFIEESNTNDKKKIQEYKRTEDTLNKILNEQVFSEMPSQDSISNMVYEDFGEYSSKDEETGLISSIDARAAITLVYKYCNSLYKSKFVTLYPSWILQKDFNSYRVEVKLPPVSPLKETVTTKQQYKRIVLAKQATALEVCKWLHKVGELTDRLLPKTEKDVLDKLDHLFPNWIHETSKDKLSKGINPKRHHKIKYADCLFKAFPSQEKDLYLHIIEMKPIYFPPEDNRRLIFYNLLKKNAGFGILSTKIMLPIPQFPIYMRDGEVSINIHVNHSRARFCQEVIDKMKVFHTLLFTKVVERIIQKFMVFDTMHLENSFLIVPLDENWEINLDVVINYQELHYTEPTVRGELDSYADYENAVITPNYRGSESVYIVTEVCDDLTPESIFPKPTYRTYIDYFAQKHQQQITNTKQPMLEVKLISVKLNFSKPWKPTHLIRKKRGEEEDLAEHLVPELCKKVEFPALYWYKATALPTVLYRLSQLLVAEELRSKIARETGVGIVELPPGQKWKPTVFDRSEYFKLERCSSEESLCDNTSEDSDYEVICDQQVDIINPENDIINKDNTNYPWSPDEEPVNLFSNIEEFQYIDIEYYHKFMSNAQPTVNIIQFNKFKDIDSSIKVPKLKLLHRNTSQGPEIFDILKATTSVKALDAFNNERLETLGDAFLKFVTCMYLYESFPTYNEGHLTAVKGKIVGNRNLYYCALKKDIPGILTVDEFKPPSNNAMTPGYSVCRKLQEIMRENKTCPNFLYEIPSMTLEERLSGNIEQDKFNIILEKLKEWTLEKMETGTEHFMALKVIKDKTIADSVEALIGVYLEKSGIIPAMKIIKWFGILPELSVDEIFLPPKHNPLIAEGVDPNNFLPLANIIEKRIGYKFKNRAYLLQALTHPSYIMNGITASYERLEFLGDALLDFLITVHIYETCTNLTPGGLTDLRSALVNNITFASLAVRHGLHSSFLCFASSLLEAIDTFVKFQEQRNYVIDDELIQLLLEEEEAKMAEHVDVPKVLGDIFESTIGAIYLDCGKDINKVWEVIYKIMHKEIIEFSKKTPKNCVRALFETERANPMFYKYTKIDNTDVVMVPVDVTVHEKRVRFHGFGNNKKQAKCAAAKLALKYIKNARTTA